MVKGVLMYLIHLDGSSSGPTMRCALKHHAHHVHNFYASRYVHLKDICIAILQIVEILHWTWMFPSSQTAEHWYNNYHMLAFYRQKSVLSLVHWFPYSAARTYIGQMGQWSNHSLGRSHQLVMYKWISAATNQTCISWYCWQWYFFIAVHPLQYIPNG